MAKILIVEDDEEIAMLERDYLEIEGFQAQVISDGGAAEEAALTGAYDLILLDLMLPGRSGYEVCRRIRDQVDVPILMVTARTESVDKIRGLGLGEDDGAIQVGDLRILPQSWKVFKGEQEIKMPNREFALLKFLAENPNIVFSKERLFETIWGYDYVGDSATVTVHVGRIRDKIEDDPASPKFVVTKRGMGYYFGG